MIGNDIVDIAEAARKSDWRRKGFLRKVFTGKEQLYISNSDNPDLIVWLLWSMKESAYKIYLRQQRKYFVSPLKLESELITCFKGSFKGKVFIENFVFSTNSKVTKEFISTTALADGKLRRGEIFQKDLEFRNKDFDKQRKEIYLSISKTFSEKINKPTGKISIKKDNFGIPYIFEEQRQLEASVSISHHGRYGAYAFVF